MRQIWKNAEQTTGRQNAEPRRGVQAQAGVALEYAAYNRLHSLPSWGLQALPPIIASLVHASFPTKQSQPAACKLGHQTIPAWGMQAFTPNNPTLGQAIFDTKLSHP